MEQTDQLDLPRLLTRDNTQMFDCPTVKTHPLLNLIGAIAKYFFKQHRWDTRLQVLCHLGAGQIRVVNSPLVGISCFSISAHVYLAFSTELFTL